MKKLIPVLFLIALASCGKKSDSEKVKSDLKIESLSYTVDTVLVDPGDSILFANRLAISLDKKTLFNFNSRKAELDIIDLDQLVIRDRISFEKEGPLGIGKYASSIQETNSGELFIFGFSDLRKLNKQKDSLTIFQFATAEFGGDGLEEIEELKFSFLVSEDGSKYFAPYGEQGFQKANTGIVIVELATMDLKKVPLDLFERSNQYVRRFIEDGKLQSQSNEMIDIYPLKNKLIISSHNFNEAYLYELGTGLLTHKVFQSELTSNAKKVSEKNTGNTFEEMLEIASEAEKEVDFGTFLYDDKSDRVFRFTRDLDHMIGDSVTYKNILTIFDTDLNPLYEQEVDFRRPGFSFFKDGKLYSYVNVDDELGFAVFTFDF
jgi:hypothetical protein